MLLYNQYLLVLVVLCWGEMSLIRAYICTSSNHHRAHRVFLRLIHLNSALVLVRVNLTYSERLVSFQVLSRKDFMRAQEDPRSGPARSIQTTGLVGREFGHAWPGLPRCAHQ